MYTDNNSKATQASETADRLTDHSTIEHLREIARKHQVCYELWPERSVAEGRKIQIGFELQLCGANEHLATNGVQVPIPGCGYCLLTFEEMKQIAEWILPREERPSRYEIGGFDRALHVAPYSRHSRSEVVVTIHIMHQTNFNREVNACENRCLSEMRDRLNELGIYEGQWRSQAEESWR